MNLIEFMKIKKKSVLFFLSIIFFMNTTLFLSEEVSLKVDSLVYTNLVLCSIAIAFFLYEYFLEKKYYENWFLILKKESVEPEDFTFEWKEEHIIINKMIKKLITENKKKLFDCNHQIKEDLDYISSWVHEIKLPIAALLLLIEQKDPYDDFIISLKDEVLRIENLIDQNLYYSKSKTFAKDYIVRAFDLQKLLNKLIKSYKNIFISKKISLDMTKIDLTVLSDDNWVYFILNQILSNALKYSREYGKIKIFLKEKEELSYSLIIEDSGVGIPKRDINRIFERGFCGENGRKFGKSTGMGLYLSKLLAEKLELNLKVESIENEFTRVEIEFLKKNIK